MPIESGISSANINQPQQPVSVDKRGSSDRVATDLSGSRPQTNVAIRSAITDLSKVLAEITGTQSENIDSMPPEIQKLVRELLQNSFSIDKTVGQGLGETMQARRYVFDQLSALGKILTQLSELMENENFTGLPENIKTILSSFRELLSQSGQFPNTVDLAKAAFNLLNNKNVADLPKVLQSIINTAAEGGAPEQVPLGSNLQSLKAVLDTLFKDNTGAPGNNSTGATGQSTGNANDVTADAGKTPAGVQTGTAGNIGADKSGMPATNTQQSNIAASNAQGAVGEGQENAVQTPDKAAGPPIAEMVGKGQVNNAGTNVAEAKNNAVGQKDVLPPETPAGSAVEQSKQQAAVKNESIQSSAVKTFTPGDAAGSVSSTAVKAGLSDIINNTPQSVQILRELGQLVLRDSQLSPKDVILLKDFINNNQSVLPEKDAVQLQKAMTVVEQNIPGVITQAAARQNMPNIAKLWAFMQLTDLSTINEVNAAALKQAGKDIRDFSKIMSHSFTAESSATVTQKSLDFILPVFLDEQKSYPAYINVYNEGRRNPDTDEEQYETWFRVCCLTENAGAVEVVLRLYNKQHLNIRLSFSNEETAVSFEEYLPSLRSYLHESKLVLTELKIGAID